MSRLCDSVKNCLLVEGVRLVLVCEKGKLKHKEQNVQSETQRAEFASAGEGIKLPFKA